MEEELGAPSTRDPLDFVYSAYSPPIPYRCFHHVIVLSRYSPRCMQPLQTVKLQCIGKPQLATVSLNLIRCNVLRLMFVSTQVTDYGLPNFLLGQVFDESEHDTFRRECWNALLQTGMLGLGLGLALRTGNSGLGLGLGLGT